MEYHKKSLINDITIPPFPYPRQTLYEYLKNVQDWMNQIIFLFQSNLSDNSENEMVTAFYHRPRVPTYNLRKELILLSRKNFLLASQILQVYDYVLHGTSFDWMSVFEDQQYHRNIYVSKWVSPVQRWSSWRIMQFPKISQYSTYITFDKAVSDWFSYSSYTLNNKIANFIEQIEINDSLEDERLNLLNTQRTRAVNFSNPDYSEQQMSELPFFDHLPSSKSNSAINEIAEKPDISNISKSYGDFHKHSLFEEADFLQSNGKRLKSDDFFLHPSKLSIRFNLLPASFSPLYGSVKPPKPPKIFKLINGGTKIPCLDNFLQISKLPPSKKRPIRSELPKFVSDGIQFGFDSPIPRHEIIPRAPIPSRDKVHIPASEFWKLLYLPHPTTLQKLKIFEYIVSNSSQMDTIEKLYHAIKVMSFFVPISYAEPELSHLPHVSPELQAVHHSVFMAHYSFALQTQLSTLKVRCQSLRKRCSINTNFQNVVSQLEEKITSDDVHVIGAIFEALACLHTYEVIHPLALTPLFVNRFAMADPEYFNKFTMIVHASVDLTSYCFRCLAIRPKGGVYSLQTVNFFACLSQTASKFLYDAMFRNCEWVTMHCFTAVNSLTNEHPVNGWLFVRNITSLLERKRMDSKKRCGGWDQDCLTLRGLLMAFLDIDWDHPASLVMELETFTYLLHEKSSCDVFSNENSCALIFRLLNHPTDEVALEAWNLLVKIFLIHPSLIEPTLKAGIFGPFFLEQLQKLKDFRYELKVINLISSLIDLLIPPEGMANKDLIFSLPMLPKSLVIFFQILNDAGFQPMKVVAAARRIRPYQRLSPCFPILKRWEYMLTKRPSMKPLINQIGYRGKIAQTK